MHSNRYTLIFVFIVTIVLGTILSFTKENLRESQENNLKADVNKTILRSLGFSEKQGSSWSNEDVEKIFSSNVVGLCVDPQGNIIDNIVLEEIDIEKNIEQLPVYLRVVDGEFQGIALPVAGKGLWSTVFGYIALEPDLNTENVVVIGNGKETAASFNTEKMKEETCAFPTVVKSSITDPWFARYIDS